MTRYSLLAFVLAASFGHGLAALAAAAASAAGRHPTGAAASVVDDPLHSITQLTDTLQNLRKSLEDSSREADNIGSAVASRCTAALHFLNGETSAEAAHLGHLRAELQEQQAAVEEAEGTAQQVHADRAMVQRTLNRTQEMLRILSIAEANATTADVSKLTDMVENKRQTLTSLQGELEVLMPDLAQMKARATETKRRLADRTDSATGARRLMAALKDGCARGEHRANEETIARAKEQNSIDMALHALSQIAGGQLSLAAVGSRGPSQADTSEEALKDVDTVVDSFVQLDSKHEGVHHRLASYDEQGSDVKEIAGTSDDADAASAEDSEASSTEDASGEQSPEADSGTSEEDLESIFGAVGASAEPSRAAEAAEKEHADAAAVPRPPPRAQENRRQNTPALKPQIQQLLNRLESGERRQGQERTQKWCEQEQAHSRLHMRLAQANADELGSQAGAHAEAQAELREELDQIGRNAVQVNKTAIEFAEGAAREKHHVAKNAKDQVLAARILGQAMVIIADVRKQQGSDGLGPAAEAAIKALTSARASLDTWAKAAQRTLLEVTKSERVVAKSAAQTSEALKRERTSLQFAVEAHGSDSAQSLEDKRLSDAEKQDADEYYQSLARECSTGAASKAQEHEEVVEIRALQDAKTILDGSSPDLVPTADVDAPQDTANTPSLRGGAVAAMAGAAPSTSNLSPLERAALSVGLATDED